MKKYISLLIRQKYLIHTILSNNIFQPRVYRISYTSEYPGFRIYQSMPDFVYTRVSRISYIPEYPGFRI